MQTVTSARDDRRHDVDVNKPAVARKREQDAGDEAVGAARGSNARLARLWWSRICPRTLAQWFCGGARASDSRRRRSRNNRRRHSASAPRARRRSPRETGSKPGRHNLARPARCRPRSRYCSALSATGSEAAIVRVSLQRCGKRARRYKRCAWLRRRGEISAEFCDVVACEW